MEEHQNGERRTYVVLTRGTQEFVRGTRIERRHSGSGMALVIWDGDEEAAYFVHGSWDGVKVNQRREGAIQADITKTATA